MTIFTLLHALLLSCVFSGIWGFQPPWRGHHHARREHPAKVVVAAHEHGHGALKVHTRGGRTHVKLGSDRHGLEVWTDEGGKTRVDLGGALKVETDERGGSKVRMGDLVVDTDGSD